MDDKSKGVIMALYSAGSTVIEMISSDKGKLEKRKEQVEKMFPSLSFVITTIEEYGEACYQAGFISGEDSMRE